MKPSAITSAATMAAMGCRNAAWALHARTLAALAAIARAELSADALPEEARLQAARNRATSTTGGVAIISIRGLITPRPSFLSLLFGGGGGLAEIRGALADAVNSEDIAAIVLEFDSPGGSTDLLAETAAEIRGARAVKPVIAVANTWAASAAYWLAAQADEVVVTPTGEVGSIGVFSVHEDWSGFNAELGILPTYISAGKYKVEGNPDEPLSDEARAAIQATIDQFYGMFVADVAKGRGVSPAAIRDGFGQGRMLTAKDAVAEGMADRVETLDATIARVVRAPNRVPRKGAAPDPSPTAKAADIDPGTPAPNPPEGGEEATARPSQAYLDLRFAPAR